MDVVLLHHPAWRQSVTLTLFCWRLFHEGRVFRQQSSLKPWCFLLGWCPKSTLVSLTHNTFSLAALGSVKVCCNSLGREQANANSSLNFSCHYRLHASWSCFPKCILKPHVTSLTVNHFAPEQELKQLLQIESLLIELLHLCFFSSDMSKYPKWRKIFNLLHELFLFTRMKLRR